MFVLHCVMRKTRFDIDILNCGAHAVLSTAPDFTTQISLCVVKMSLRCFVRRGSCKDVCVQTQRAASVAFLIKTAPH